MSVVSEYYNTVIDIFYKYLNDIILIIFSGCRSRNSGNLTGSTLLEDECS